MLSSANLPHDAYLASLASIPAQKLYTLTADGAVAVFAEVSGTAIIQKLAVSQTDLRGDVDRVVPEIMHWGRLVALQKRVWVVREREYRVWKARFEVAFRQLHAQSKEGWGQGGKVSGDQVEAAYRTDPGYVGVSLELEAAEEAYLFADAVYRAFRAKMDLLLQDVRRLPDGSMQRIS